MRSSLDMGVRRSVAERCDRRRWSVKLTCASASFDSARRSSWQSGSQDTDIHIEWNQSKTTNRRANVHEQGNTNIYMGWGVGGGTSWRRASRSSRVPGAATASSWTKEKRHRRNCDCELLNSFFFFESRSITPRLLSAMCN